METNELVDRYVELWMEPDPERRLERVRELYTEDAQYANGLREYRGHEGIALAVTRSHDKWVGTGHRFRPGGVVTAHHDAVRMNWHMFSDGGDEPLSVGTDVFRLAPDGRIAWDYQFIDR